MQDYRPRRDQLALMGAIMSDELDREQKFRLKALANKFLLRGALIRLMLLDPRFAQDARQWFDTYLLETFLVNLARLLMGK
jgi:hypothetical protein